MQRARELLRDTFGFKEFREGQEAVVSRLASGASVVAIFPTGAGKSLCYQLPALMLDGLTVVVSPLIALMKDQLDFLVRHGVAAARLDSSLDVGEARRVAEELRNGRLKILYVAPERFGSERFVSALKRRPVSLLAVDEAHCISEWGHNFRPDYLKLAGLAREVGVQRVLALTATATPEVAADIARSFGVQDSDVVRTGFHRPNLFLEVTACATRDRLELLLARLRGRGATPAPRGSAIVYVTLQRTAEEVAERLAAEGLPARCYHAGLADAVRHQVQDWFMASDRAVVVATIAFGMGVDKAGIRAVYHYNLPKSLESYAQEIGRAGRDGQPARCEMLAAPEDVITLENFSYGDTPGREALSGLLADVLGTGTGEPAPRGIAGASSASEGPGRSPGSIPIRSPGEGTPPAEAARPDEPGEPDGGGRSPGRIPESSSTAAGELAVSPYELSQRHDIRPLVLDTVLTYLELDGVLRSTGAFYTEYKLQFPCGTGAALASLEEGSRALFEQVLEVAKEGRVWWALDMKVTMEALGVERGVLVRLLGDLEERAGVDVKTAGLRRGYRRLAAEVELEALVERLDARFVEREARDVARTARVVQLVGHAGCLTRHLVAYFGEPLGECGHCARCAGRPPMAPRMPAEARGAEARVRELNRELVEEDLPALATPRQRARFLCGLTSPATTRAKLSRDPRFGALAGLRFRRVLELVSMTA